MPGMQDVDYFNSRACNPIHHDIIRMNNDLTCACNQLRTIQVGMLRQVGYRLFDRILEALIGNRITISNVAAYLCQTRTSLSPQKYGQHAVWRR